MATSRRLSIMSKQVVEYISKHCVIADVLGQRQGVNNADSSYESISTWHLYMVQSNRKHKRSNPLKHKLTVLFSILIIVGTAALCVVKYEHVRNNRDYLAAKAKITAYVQAQAKAEQTKQNHATVNALEAQCSKDHQLFVSTKGKSPAGDCNTSLQVVQ